MTNIAIMRYAVRRYSAGQSDSALWQLVDQQGDQLARHVADAFDDLDHGVGGLTLAERLGECITDNVDAWTRRAGEAEILRRHAGSLAQACVMAAQDAVVAATPDVATGNVEAASIIESTLARFSIDDRNGNAAFRDRLVKAIVGSLHEAGCLVAPSGHTLDEQVSVAMPGTLELVRQASDDVLAYERFRHVSAQDGAEPTLTVAALRHVLRSEDGESLMTVADGTRPTTVVRLVGFAEYGTERSAARVCLLTEPSRDEADADLDAYDYWRCSPPGTTVTAAALRYWLRKAPAHTPIGVHRDGQTVRAWGLGGSEQGGGLAIIGEDIGHDHDQQLRHLINEWGALGVLSKLLDPLGDAGAAELWDAWYQRAKRDPVYVLARGLVIGGIGTEQAHALASLGLESLDEAGLRVDRGNTEEPGS